MEQPHHYSVHTTGGELGSASLEKAVVACRIMQKNGYGGFITARDSDGAVMFVVAVAEYPVVGSMSDGEEERAVRSAVDMFATMMDWTI